MGENREIQKGVWEGRIPVVFRLSEEDTEGERPEPVYVSVVVFAWVRQKPTYIWYENFYF